MPVINAKNANAVNSRCYEAQHAPRWTKLHRIDTVSANIEDVKKAIFNYPFQKLLYAEGDSWFDKFTPMPASCTNLLDAIRLPMFTGVVDVSHIGDLAREMVSGMQRDRTAAMFDFFDFDAILYSGGGNDLKNLFAEKYGQLGGQLVPDEEQFFSEVIANVRAFISLRDNCRNSITRAAPIFVHGYDYIQPRPVKGAIFGDLLKVAGPWLYPNMRQAGLSDAEMLDAAKAAIDKLNAMLYEVVRTEHDIHLIDQRGLLTPAVPGSTTASGDWLDEIHPSEAGFATLANNRWNHALAQSLGWSAKAGDSVPPVDAK